MGTAAKIGIGIAIPILVIVVAGIVLVFWQRCYPAKTAAGLASGPPNPRAGANTYADPTHGLSSTVQVRTELPVDGTEQYELEDQQIVPVGELSSDTLRRR